MVTFNFVRPLTTLSIAHVVTAGECGRVCNESIHCCALLPVEAWSETRSCVAFGQHKGRWSLNDEHPECDSHSDVSLLPHALLGICAQIAYTVDIDDQGRPSKGFRI